MPDFSQYFPGIDLHSEATWERPWYWLRAHIWALLDIPDSRASTVLYR